MKTSSERLAISFENIRAAGIFKLCPFLLIIVSPANWFGLQNYPYEKDLF